MRLACGSISQRSRRAACVAMILVSVMVLSSVQLGSAPVSAPSSAPAQGSTVATSPPPASTTTPSSPELTGHPAAPASIPGDSQVRRGTPSITPSGANSDGVGQLDAAQASLQGGFGPAGGVPQICARASAPASVSCSAQGTNTGEGSYPSTPASIANPSAGLGWQIQGVPSGRAYATELMTWDARDGYVLLFGGSNYTGTYNGDTWTYLHGIWTELALSVAPIGRDSSAMVYDAEDNYVVLFGGYAPGSGGVLNDTWIFFSGTWQLDPYASNHGPSPRWGFAMTYDAATAYVVLFGGASPLCTGNSYLVCSDTWRFWHSGWDRITPKNAPPAPRDQLAMTYDAADGYPLLFGGYGPQCLAGSFMCQDTWFWNATGYGAVGNWTQVKTGGAVCGTQAEGKCGLGAAPGERIQIQLGFDVADNEVVLFGGSNSSVGTLGDTWVYFAGNWTKLSPLTSAYGRWGGGLVYDVSDGYLLLWGGGPIYDTPVDGVWQFAAGNWTEVAPGVGPAEVHGATMTFDPVDGYVVLFGGYGLAGFLRETWTYKSGTWSQLPLAASQQPFARWFASMTWDGADGYVLLFGGGDFGLLNDTWSFLHGTWTERCAGGTPACAPPAREFAGLVYNLVDGYPELFGGFGAGGYRNDTWIWFGSLWLNETIPTHAPSTRASMGMTYDAADGEVVLFGGSNGSAVYADTWTMVSIFVGWYEVGSCGGPGQVACGPSTPSPRANLVFVYDGADQLVYAAGGINGIFGGSYQAYSYAFKAGIWYFCPGNYCTDGFQGWAPYITWTAAVYDPIDGYVVVRDGTVPFGQYGGNSYSRDTWVFGRMVTGTPPASSFDVVDLGQTTTLVEGAAGGGFGTFSYQWNGLPLGCAPPSPTATALTCTVSQGGLTFYYQSPVYGSYFVLSAVITDSNGFPGITTYQDTLYAYPDPTVTVSESTAAAEVGQTVWLNATVHEGWGPYAFGSWSGLPPGCAVFSTNNSTQEERCFVTAADVGRWSIVTSVSDSTSFIADSAAVPLTVVSGLGVTEVTVNRFALDAGQALSYATTVSGGVPPYGFAWSNVPDACQADAMLLTCIVPADEVGTYAHPQVVVSDASGVVTTETLVGTIVVSPAPVATEVTVTANGANPGANVTEGTAITFALQLSPGSGGDTIVWTGLPPTCIPSGTDAPTVSCSPTAMGSYDVFATANDSNGGSTTSPIHVLTISPTPPPAAAKSPAAPFATSFQWLELGLLLVLILLAVIAVVLMMRRENGDSEPPLAPEPSPPAPAAPPPGAVGPPSTSDASSKEWSETPDATNPSEPR